MSPQTQMAGLQHPGASAKAAVEAGPFVLNLCSSTTPMALPHPDSPELKRFSFFVSRRREEGRERFRLHMGYFSTLAEAEEWLNAVRDIYPGAWAGEAPGKKLREREAAQAATAAAPAKPVARAVEAPRPAPVVARVEAPRSVAVQANLGRRVEAPKPAAAAARPNVARPAAPVQPGAQRPAAPAPRQAVPNIPTVHAAPAMTPRQAAKSALAATRSALQTRAAAQARPAEPVRAPAPQAKPAMPQRKGPVPQAAAPAKPAVPAASRPAPAPQPKAPLSNVREVLASLDETGETRSMRAPVPPQAVAPTEPKQNLSDTQVLKILEQRRPADARNNEEANSVALLKPDDTGTRRALKQAVQENAPVAFAVQLQWSVQPVALDKVPPLAIFSAYTLYTVEGSREGRRWYGLRLGFFTDAISAKQVAYYVRSEFTSVAVVPVSPQERSRATDAENKAANAAFPKHQTFQRTEEFKLLDDDTPAPLGRTQQMPALKHKPTPAKPMRPAPGAKRNAKSGGKVRARDKKSPQTLEETLEILGASELQMDNDRGTLLNDTGVRHLRVEVKKDTAFSRLLDRLSERVRKD